MDTANNEDNSLKNAAKVFNKIGWEKKKLCDLTEEQMVALISVIQSSREIENEFVCDYVTQSHIKYFGPNQATQKDLKTYPFEDQIADFVDKGIKEKSDSIPRRTYLGGLHWRKVFKKNTIHLYGSGS